MDPVKRFVITDCLNIIMKDVQLNTCIVFRNDKNNEHITLDVDKWTQFKQNIEAIDKEFYRRFNYQYSNV